jgi:hypothetical protein
MGECRTCDTSDCAGATGDGAVLVLVDRVGDVPGPVGLNGTLVGNITPEAGARDHFAETIDVGVPGERRCDLGDVRRVFITYITPVYLEVRVLKYEREAVQRSRVVRRDGWNWRVRERGQAGVEERRSGGVRAAGDPESKGRGVVVENEVRACARRALLCTRRGDHLRWYRELRLRGVVDVHMQSTRVMSTRTRRKRHELRTASCSRKRRR